MNQKDIEKEKMKLHLKYWIVIFIVLSCIVGGLSLYNQDFAIRGLSNAGLLLSIVLAVIAILISLWDVSGQRNSVFEIKEQMQLIRNITDEIKESSVSSKEVLEKLENVNERFSMDFEPIKLSIVEINKKLLETSPHEFEDIKKSMTEMAELIEEKERDLSAMKKTFTKDNNQKNINFYIEKFLETIETNKEFNVTEVVEFILNSWRNEDRLNRAISYRHIKDGLEFLELVGMVVRLKNGNYKKI